MTRQHRYKGLRRKPQRDASYEDGDQWEFIDKKLPIRDKQFKAVAQKQPRFDSVEAPRQ